MKDLPSTTAGQAPRGLECPRCGCRHFRVVYTRAAQGGRIMRRRECRHCGRRITTSERVGI
jgi:transcriptional regulator NrdR family protein